MKMILRVGLLFIAAGIVLSGCSVNPETDQSVKKGSALQVMDATLSGANGSVVVSAMTGTSLTVTYSPGVQYSSCNLYLSQGNGTGLVLAAQPMNYSGGTYTYTFSNPSFVANAVIYICILRNNAGVESCVPQGTLGTTTSWSTFVYGSSTAAVTKIEAESYTTMSGVATESCSDTGGGLDVGWIDSGDWMVYPITITTTGTYTIQYRVASPNSGKYLSSDLNAGSIQLGTVTIPNTTSWQSWQTVSQTVTLNAGTYNFGINAGSGGFNLNWFTIQYTGGSTPTPTPTPAPTPVGPAGYTYCAPENGSFTLPGTCDVAYGANGSFSNLYGKTGTITFNNATFGDPIPGVVKAGFYKPSSSTDTLIARNAGMRATLQFKNSTGVFTSDSIYVAVLCLNTSGQFCHLTPSGQLAVDSGSDNGALTVNGTGYANYFYKLSDINGFQLPNGVISARIWISMQRPLYIHVNTDASGKVVGIAPPDINNPNDANLNTYFDWVEINVDSIALWINTTCVDMFGFPTVVSAYNGSDNSYSLFQTIGIQESRAAICSEFSALGSPWSSLVQQYRIAAPLHSSMATSFWDTYRDQIWAQYTTSDLVVDNEFGHFVGRVQSDGQLKFSRDGDAGNYYYIPKPTTANIFGGDGPLNHISAQYQNDSSRSGIEPRLGAQICSAFHRHVMQNSSIWNTPSQYYLTEPYDHYAKFWHDHSIDNKAYGYCYDDTAGQDPTIVATTPRGMIIDVRW